MINNIQAQKTLLRKQIIEKRREISLSQKQLWDSKIFKNFLDFTDVNNTLQFAVYNSLSGEVDTKSIINYLIENGKKVYLPKTFQDGKMEFYFVDKSTKLTKSEFGTFEPAGDTERFEGENAVCIVPGLCFTKDGKRLGYGAGYYDRFLENKNLLKIAFAYSCFILQDVPCSQHDIKIDYIINEDGVINCAESREA